MLSFLDLSHTAKEHAPGPEVELENDAQILEFIKKAIATTWRE